MNVETFREYHGCDQNADPVTTLDQSEPTFAAYTTVYVCSSSESVRMSTIETALWV